MNINPFDHNYFLGYVSEVTPQYCKLHFPSSVLLNPYCINGETFAGGLVGSYVAIEGESHGFLGRMLELSMPEAERLQLTEKAFQNKEFHPTGKVEILISFNLFDPQPTRRGLDSFPHVGAKVFSCTSDFLQSYVGKFGVKSGSGGSTCYSCHPLMIKLAQA